MTTENRRADPLPEVLIVAAGLYGAKNALRPNPKDPYYGKPAYVRRAVAQGQLAYAIDGFWVAANAVEDAGGKFRNFELDTAWGRMNLAMRELMDDDRECTLQYALGIMGEAHAILWQLNRRWGYRDPTDEELEQIVLTVGGGR